MYRIVLFLVVITCFFSCSKSHKQDSNGISLEKINDTLHYVQIKTDSLTDKWKLPYPIYQFQVGDINNNGVDDIMVGVIKTTRFDSTLSKRLFIFKNYKGYVRPLWLGSRLGQDLVDFRFFEGKEYAFIRSIEKEKSGNYLVAEYKWNSFGLKFVKYIQREIGLDEAQELLKE